ncbi:MAG: hypothetical protein DMD71_07180 [Gemmatimonadetes bacterium]|nr:MAG: hypothetical protein DMD71_07180 [Gemmatimonadota bacterium]
MNAHFNTLRVRWAGPAVLTVLFGLAVTPRPAVAAAPAAAVAAATRTMALPCYQEAIAYIDAWIAYIEAWRDYENTLPGGTEQEIMDSARRLDQAATAVGTAGWRLVKCLAPLSSSGPIIP